LERFEIRGQGMNRIPEFPQSLLNLDTKATKVKESYDSPGIATQKIHLVHKEFIDAVSWLTIIDISPRLMNVLFD
jgi:hypothetical protein